MRVFSGVAEFFDHGDYLFESKDDSTALQLFDFDLVCLVQGDTKAHGPSWVSNCQQIELDRELGKRGFKCYLRIGVSVCSEGIADEY